MKEILAILIINDIPHTSFNWAYRTPCLQVTQEALVECGLETTDASSSLLVQYWLWYCVRYHQIATLLCRVGWSLMNLAKMDQWTLWNTWISYRLCESCVGADAVILALICWFFFFFFLVGSFVGFVSFFLTTCVLPWSRIAWAMGGKIAMHLIH